MDSIFPCKTKTCQETERSLRRFLEPTERPKVIYTDNSLEFGKFCEDISWNHCTSATHRSETKGIAERAVHTRKEGTSAALLHSGLDEKWWADSMECYRHLRNVQDLLADGESGQRRETGGTVSCQLRVPSFSVTHPCVVQAPFWSHICVLALSKALVL